MGTAKNETQTEVCAAYSRPVSGPMVLFTAIVETEAPVSLK